MRTLLSLRALRPVRGGSLAICGLLIVLTLLFLLAGAAPAQAQPPDSAASDAASERVLLRLEQAAQEYDAVIARSLSRLDATITEAKAGARPFAESVLGAAGKAEYASSVAEQAGDTLRGVAADLFGADPFGDDSQAWRFDADHFTRYVHDRFSAQIIAPEALEALCQGVLNDSADQFEALENQILIELQADLPDLDLGAGVAPAAPGAGGLIEMPIAAFTVEVVDTATADITAAIGRVVISLLAGEMVAREITPDDATGIERLSYNVGAGIVADKAIDQALAIAGYDSQGALALRVNAALDELRLVLLEGDPVAAGCYSQLLSLAGLHPVAEVRAACREAAAAMEQDAPLGLEIRLRAMAAERRLALMLALIEAIRGPLPPESLYASPDAYGETTPEAFIAAANQIKAIHRPDGE